VASVETAHISLSSRPNELSFIPCLSINASKTDNAVDDEELWADALAAPSLHRFCGDLSFVCKFLFGEPLVHFRPSLRAYVGGCLGWGEIEGWSAKREACDLQICETVKPKSRR
jgi:hypothetical protein